MLCRAIIKKGFCTTGSNYKGGFNILSSFNRIKSAVKAPVKHFKRTIEPSGVDYNLMTNTTEEAFDEVSHEW